jgi:hypothetical protein
MHTDGVMTKSNGNGQHRVFAAPAGGRQTHDLKSALFECRAAQRSIQSILHYARRGAHDLFTGLSWSNSLERFEALSMAQARSLAKFPIASEDPRFGSDIRKAKTAFIDFRETVRREAISIIEPDIQEDMLADVLRKIGDKAAAATAQLEQLEQALDKAQAG